MNKKPIIAFLYDFDKTLCTTDMEDYAFIPSLGYTPSEFWAKANGFGYENKMDGLLAYMYTMIRECAAQGIRLDRDYLVRSGEAIELFPGVREWFARITAYGADLGVDVEHYVISSGLREIIEGSGIAHEFNNFLTPITGYADLIMADADPGSEIYDNAMEISEAAQKAQEVVKQISSMSRKNVETVYDAVSVEGLLHRTRKLVETNCPKNVELKEENELSGECVLGNATQLQQVLLNISINAIHAIGTEGGKLTIRGSVVPRSELAALFPEEKISEEWSSYVCLSVTDTGCGMDKETMQHIFEPFFTTKKTGEGTGLGLALADQIIRTHRGRIRAESTIGRGTTFYVYLPVLEQQQEREQLQWGVDSKLRILAADDNNKVLDLLDKDLSALGLSVSTCSRRGELRQLLEQQPFDVLAIDESLMSSSGVDFCMAIRGRYPGMTRIVMTNAPTREIVDARSHGVIDGYVVKPVSASTLLAQIRSSRKE